MPPEDPTTIIVSIGALATGLTAVSGGLIWLLRHLFVTFIPQERQTFCEQLAAERLVFKAGFEQLAGSIEKLACARPEPQPLRTSHSCEPLQP
jgi:hypothetical protein